MSHLGLLLNQWKFCDGYQIYGDKFGFVFCIHIVVSEHIFLLYILTIFKIIILYLSQIHVSIITAIIP
jgi:hypothetical protein